MPLDPNTENHLLGILSEFFNADEKRGEHASLVLTKFAQIEFDADTDEFVSQLISDNEGNFVYQFAKYLVLKRILSFECKAKIVAYLLRDGRLTENEAVELISEDCSQNANSNNPNIRNLIKVIWLVVEDKKDGIMNVSDDSLVRPDTGGRFYPGKGSLIANIGRDNGVMRLNYVFTKAALPSVMFFTPK